MSLVKTENSTVISMAKMYTPLCNVLTAKFPSNSSAGA